MKSRFRLPPIPLFHLEPLEPRRILNAGFLDPTIVPGGAVTLDLGVDLKHLEFDGQPAIIQPDGKIVVLAETWGSQADCSPNIDGDIGDLAILFSRFNADGSRDSSFGTNGVATVPCMVDYAYNPILQPDGKLLVIGPYDGIIRITANGQRDTTFRSQGVEYSGMFWDSNLDWMTLAPDGKLLVGGEALHPGSNSTFTVVGINPDGSIDTSFGSGGSVNESFVDDFAYASSLLVQSDGKLLAFGWNRRNADLGRNDYPNSLLRFNPDGTPDSAFGQGGRVLLPGPDRWGPIHQQPDGKIIQMLFSSERPLSSNGITLLRFNQNGGLDSSFGGKGQVNLNWPWSRRVYYSSFDTLVQPDGKIIVWETSGGFERLNPDGSLDTTFGVNGFISLRPTASGHQLTVSSVFLRRGHLLITALEFYRDPARDPALLVDPDSADWRAVRLISLTTDASQPWQFISGDSSIIVATPMPGAAMDSSLSQPTPSDALPEVDDEASLFDTADPLDWQGDQSVIWE